MILTSPVNWLCSHLFIIFHLSTFRCHQPPVIFLKCLVRGKKILRMICMCSVELSDSKVTADIMCLMVKFIFTYKKNKSCIKITISSMLSLFTDPQVLQ